MHRLFNYTKKLIPKISNTELIALRSGTTSIDRDIFNGLVSLPSTSHKVFNEKEDKFYNSTVENILKKYGSEIVYDYQRPSVDIMNHLGKEKFFSFIIDEKQKYLVIIHLWE